MNGRCTADPLDHADDICDFCGDEFCTSCLIATRKGKGPLVCRECAIDNSGIKGSRPTKPRATKSQINKARAALAEAKNTRTAKSFQFFDEEDGYVSPEVESTDHDEIEDEEAAEGSTAKRRFSLRRRHDDTPISTDDDHPETSELLEAIDEEPALDPVIEPTPTDHAPPGRSTPATALIESGGLARLSAGESVSPQQPTSHDDSHDLVDDAPAAPGGSTTAGPTFTSLADRLRTPAARPAPPQSRGPASFHDDDRAVTPPPSSAVDVPAPAEPTPATVTRWVTDPAPIPQPAAMDLDSDPFASPDFDLDVAVPQADAATPPIDLAFSSSTAHTDAGSSFEWQQATTPADEDLSDDPFGASAAPPPPVESARFEPASIEPIRAEPAWVEAEAVQAEEHLAHASSPRPVAVSDEPSSPSADTDAKGNWIPPLLRGMAPVVERRADPLPRRRQLD